MLSNRQIADPVKDLLIAEFGRERPDIAQDPTRRQGLYENAPGIYYLVQWKPRGHYSEMMGRAGAAPRVEDLDCREVTKDQARDWLETGYKWARRYLENDAE